MKVYTRCNKAMEHDLTDMTAIDKHFENKRKYEYQLRRKISEGRKSKQTKRHIRG